MQKSTKIVAGVVGAFVALDVQSPNTGTLTRTYDGVTPPSGLGCDGSDPAGASIVFGSASGGRMLGWQLNDLK